MRPAIPVLITVAAMIAGYLLGYAISAETGVEPGYLDAAEAGAYGVTETTEQMEGISREDLEYYESLTE